VKGFLEETGIPLYYQLKVLFKEKIENGEWSYDEQIPNELKLAEEYGVSRATIRQAILDLVRQGHLYRKQGKGTFVQKPKIEDDFIKFYFPSKLGNKHKLVRIDKLYCTHEIGLGLGLTSKDEVFRLIRVRYFNNEPSVLETSYIPKMIAPSLYQENLELRLYELLFEKYGITIVTAKTYVEPVLLNDNQAELLEVNKSNPALKLTRIAFSSHEKPVVYSQSIVRGDRCRLLIQTEST